MKAVNKGFTLIELMIVVAVIGVLAAIAIPQYQNYVAKGELGSAIATTSSLKTNAEDFVVTKGNFPTDVSSIGASHLSSAPMGAIALAASGTSGGGTIKYTLSASSVSPKAKGSIVTLTRSDDGAWACSVTGNGAPLAPKGCSSN
ncbi:pilin [Plesiomonas sp. ZOR0011]|uniref:pilin n=1 Tax=Plesiomonas sp. ZOR0011 TaxID=1339230 RepID=UPI0006486E33|nr:pilin [Plesiomonas sp. ZOR0011]